MLTHYFLSDMPTVLILAVFLSVCPFLYIVCVCVGGVWGGWHFFSALLPNSRWCLHVLPLLSSSISSQHVLQHTAASLKRYFTMFSTLIIKGWLQVQTPLETDNHQNSLIFTTVSLKGQICNTQQQICFALARLQISVLRLKDECS